MTDEGLAISLVYLVRPLGDKWQSTLTLAQGGPDVLIITTVRHLQNGQKGRVDERTNARRAPGTWMCKGSAINVCSKRIGKGEEKREK